MSFIKKRMKLSLTQLNKEQRELDDAWATMIKARDNWCCVICGNDYRVAAHHIIPRENKEYRYCPDNGVTLCVAHHKFSRIISAHNNPLAFSVWLARFLTPLSDLARQRTIKLLKENGIEI